MGPCLCGDPECRRCFPGERFAFPGEDGPTILRQESKVTILRQESKVYDSLADFAARQPRLVKCKTCRFAAEHPDLWEQVKAARRAFDALPIDTISAWLRSQGFAITSHNLVDHFRSKHGVS